MTRHEGIRQMFVEVGLDPTIVDEALAMLEKQLGPAPSAHKPMEPERYKLMKEKLQQAMGGRVAQVDSKQLKEFILAILAREAKNYRADFSVN